MTERLICILKRKSKLFTELILNIFLEIEIPLRLSLALVPFFSSIFNRSISYGQEHYHQQIIII
jgi:hypothetical protein